MTTALLVLLAVVAAGMAVGQLSMRARWATSAPRLAVASWHLLGLGSLASVVLVGLAAALLVAPPTLTAALGEFIEHCARALRSETIGPHRVFLGVAGMLLALAVTARLTGSLVRQSRQTRQERRAQLDLLALVGHRLPGVHREDRMLLDDARPAAYCLPGGPAGRGTIVMSSGMLALLDEGQVRLVLAHERAHLRQRHHLATQLSVALAHTFGRMTPFGLAAQQVPRLLEMAADDGAIRVERAAGRAATTVDGQASVRRRLAHALVTLAGAQSVAPAGTLSAAGSAAARVRRLSRPRVRPRPADVVLIASGLGIALAELLFVAASPAMCATAVGACVTGLG
ncbi:M56 family metallopeptidase [Promicromonospora sp. NPDC050880]|uniref:M56 family metallopeptidase n=1 Tax=Promicromonospora sp. NPDC050880 TaxID=3364406 RepID=UPI0037AAF5C7